MIFRGVNDALEFAVDFARVVGFVRCNGQSVAPPWTPRPPRTWMCMPPFLRHNPSPFRAMRAPFPAKGCQPSFVPGFECPLSFQGLQGTFVCVPWCLTAAFFVFHFLPCQSFGVLIACLSAWEIFSPLYIPAPISSMRENGISGAVSVAGEFWAWKVPSGK